MLRIDIENVISEVYNHFSSSAKRVQELKEVFEFVEQEHTTLYKNVIKLVACCQKLFFISWRRALSISTLEIARKRRGSRGRALWIPGIPDVFAK